VVASNTVAYPTTHYSIHIVDNHLAHPLSNHFLNYTYFSNHFSYPFFNIITTNYVFHTISISKSILFGKT